MMSGTKPYILNPPLDQLISDLEFEEVIAVDLETTGLTAWDNVVDVIVLCGAGRVYLLEVDMYEDAALTGALVTLLEVQDHVIVCHNAKFDLAFLRQHYNVTPKKIWCTLVAAQILENGLQDRYSYSLPAVLERYLGVTHKFAEHKNKIRKTFTDKSLRRTPFIRNIQLDYAAEDVPSLINLYRLQYEQLTRSNLSLIMRLEMRVLPVLISMELRGCVINAATWRSIIDNVWQPALLAVETKLDIEVKRLSERYKAISSYFKLDRVRAQTISPTLFGGDVTSELVTEGAINYSSTDQIIDLIRLTRLPFPHNDDKEPSLEEDCIKLYLATYNKTPLKEFLLLLLEHRELAKLLGTYGHKFLGKLDSLNRIHTAYTQTSTGTGRLSSKQPNLQNIPNNANVDYNVRRFFAPAPGNKFIVCDMASAEVAIAGDYSGEELLIDAMVNGVDMHSELASISFSIIFGQPVTINKSNDIVTIDDYQYKVSDLRHVHKSVVFAKFYKAGPKRVYKILADYILRHNPPEAQAAISTEISQALDARTPKLAHYLDSKIKQARANGYLISSKLGRRRFFSDDVYGDAANFPIQGTNAEANKIALIKLDDYFRARYPLKTGLDYPIVLNIHDEVVCEVPAEDAEEVAVDIERIIGVESLGRFLTKIPGKAVAVVVDCWDKP
jgi:DNA polymerase-1